MKLNLAARGTLIPLSVLLQRIREESPPENHRPAAKHLMQMHGLLELGGTPRCRAAAPQLGSYFMGQPEGRVLSAEADIGSSHLSAQPRGMQAAHGLAVYPPP